MKNIITDYQSWKEQQILQIASELDEMRNKKWVRFVAKYAWGKRMLIWYLGRVALKKVRQML